nr:pyridoxamine 5'-phosphate oxidase family protein [Fundidesulfovibrio agrisoli]
MAAGGHLQPFNVQQESSVRKAEREIKDFKLVEALLQRAEYVHMALWDGASPYVIPVSFGYKDRVLYFHSALKGRKAECLRTCDRVSFDAVLEYELCRQLKSCGYTAHFKSVVGVGRASLIEDKDAKRAALDIIMSHYDGPTGHYPDEVLDVTAVVRVDIEELTGKSNPPWQGDEALEVVETVGGEGERLSSAD